MLPGIHYVKVHINSFLYVFVTSLLIFGVSQSAPTRRERWNPYYYPTVRTLTSVSALSSSKRPIITPINKNFNLNPIIVDHNRIRQSPKSLVTTKIPLKPLLTKALASVRREARAHRQSPPYSSFNENFSNFIPTSTTSTSTLTNTTQKFLGIDIENFDVGNATAIGLALNEFLRSGEHVLREVLMFSQNELLRMIGEVDVGADRLQKRFQDSTFRLALAGQKAASVTYKSLPTLVNKLLQRLTMPMDSSSGKSLNVQLNDAIRNLRQLKKMLFQALEEHEKDFHNVFQDRFEQINQYLGVAELPRRPLAWFS